MPRNNKDARSGLGREDLPGFEGTMGMLDHFVSKYTPNAQEKKDALSEDIENATDSYQVEAAHNKHNPRPKGPHSDALEAASKNGGLTFTTQYLDSQDDK